MTYHVRPPLSNLVPLSAQHLHGSNTVARRGASARGWHELCLSGCGMDVQRSRRRANRVAWNVLAGVAGSSLQWILLVDDWTSGMSRKMLP